MKFKVGGKLKRVFAWWPVFINMGPNDAGNYAWLEFVWKRYDHGRVVSYQSDSDHEHVEKEVQKYHS